MMLNQARQLAVGHCVPLPKQFRFLVLGDPHNACIAILDWFKRRDSVNSVSFFLSQETLSEEESSA